MGMDLQNVSTNERISATRNPSSYASLKCPMKCCFWEVGTPWSSIEMDLWRGSSKKPTSAPFHRQKLPLDSMHCGFWNWLLNRHSRIWLFWQWCLLPSLKANTFYVVTKVKHWNLSTVTDIFVMSCWEQSAAKLFGTEASVSTFI